MTNIGFTGTENGMMDVQKITFRKVVFEEIPDISEFHYGDCIGADEEAFWIVTGHCKTVAHPGCNHKGESPKRAYTPASEIKKTRAYIARDHDICKSIDFLIACPKEFSEIQRSGTWATIRFARDKLGIPVLIIYPDGTLEIT